MSQNTKIQWADSTGNPWIGCTKVSPGCAKDRPVSHWGKGAPRFRTKGFWKDAVKWNRLFARGKCAICGRPAPIVDRPCECGVAGMWDRPRIFPSLCDWLDDEVPIEWLADFLKLIHDTPNLDWLLLTKRPENWRDRLCFAMQLIDREWLNGKADRASVANWIGAWIETHERGMSKTPSNVWLGASVEDQQRADERIPALLKINAKVRFLSVEPLLGNVDLRLTRSQPIHDPEYGDQHEYYEVNRGIHWVIVGGESGKQARPCHVEWIDSVVKQCQAATVPCFVKQLGAFPCCDNANMFDWLDDVELVPHGQGFAACRLFPRDKKGGDMAEWPQQLLVRQFPTA